MMSLAEAVKQDYVPIADLNVDTSYQRQLYETHVQKILRAYDEDLVDLLHVNVRADGSMWVYDGQHRMEVLRRLGQDYAPCAMKHGLTREEEAHLYRQLNSARKHTTRMDDFRAALAEGDPQAKAIDAICREAGFIIRSGGTGQANTLKAVAAAWKAYDRGVLGDVLKVVTDAWPGEHEAVDGTVINGMSFLLRNISVEPMLRGRFEMMDLAKKLGTVHPRQLLQRSRAAGGNSEISMAREIVAHYNSGKRTRLLPLDILSKSYGAAIGGVKASETKAKAGVQVEAA
jgi:hypothetical protein